MLSALSIRNIVLIEAADLEFQGGLTVLTGETGAGKSILLDALTLALGGKADRALIRNGETQASVSAEFRVSPNHPVIALLVEAGFAPAGPDEAIILRRTLSTNGTRGFINDQPVAQTMLARVGDALAEIHGQHDERGLLDPGGHRALLDEFAGNGALLKDTGRNYAEWHAILHELTSLEEAVARGRAERDYLAHAGEELSRLAPEAGEEAALAAERSRFAQGAKIASDLKDLEAAIDGEAGLLALAQTAHRRAERARSSADAALTPVAAALDHALIEIREASAALALAMKGLAHDPRRLEAIEDRLHAIKSAARKFRVAPDDLAAKKAEILAALERIDTAEARRTELLKNAKTAEAAYRAAAKTLSEARLSAAMRLDAMVNRELAPLRLGAAQFSTAIRPLDEGRASAKGIDRVEFEVQTNKGSAPGALKAIASGGELSRFILALKVVLSAEGSAATLIFDEVDRGTGGAVADATGERLARLARKSQVILVTHAPQVAARGDHHLRVVKLASAKRTEVSLTRLNENERVEEIARMLAGSHVTEEARAAARRLLEARESAPVPPRAKRRRA